MSFDRRDDEDFNSEHIINISAIQTPQPEPEEESQSLLVTEDFFLTVMVEYQKAQNKLDLLLG